VLERGIADAELFRRLARREQRGRGYHAVEVPPSPILYTVVPRPAPSGLESAASTVLSCLSRYDTFPPRGPHRNPVTAITRQCTVRMIAFRWLFPSVKEVA
jgi:hypothetical protein